MKAFRTRFFLVPAGAVLLAGLVAGGSDAGARDVKPAAMKSAKHGGAPAENVETRIKSLHSQLRITPEQESGVQECRAGHARQRERPRALREQKAEAVESANALDQLNSYAAPHRRPRGRRASSSPRSRRRFDGLSPEQKKAADVAFREKARQATKRGSYDDSPIARHHARRAGALSDDGRSRPAPTTTITAMGDAATGSTTSAPTGIDRTTIGRTATSRADTTTTRHRRCTWSSRPRRTASTWSSRSTSAERRFAEPVSDSSPKPRREGNPGTRPPAGQSRRDPRGRWRGRARERSPDADSRPGG